MIALSSEMAWIFRITHVENVPWILANGLHCRNSGQRDPNYHEIGNPDLIEKRARRIVPIPPGGTLSDYVPFYFTPYSPMLLNIKTGHGGMRQTPMSDIVFLVSSLPKVAEQGLQFVFTDRHAYLAAAEFSNDLKDLSRVDWKILQARDFKRDPDDPGKFERYQAEALIHRHLPISGLAGIACREAAQEASLSRQLEEAGISLKVVHKPNWYF
jgi:hypothetical protein